MNELYEVVKAECYANTEGICIMSLQQIQCSSGISLVERLCIINPKVNVWDERQFQLRFIHDSSQPIPTAISCKCMRPVMVMKCYRLRRYVTLA